HVDARRGLARRGRPAPPLRLRHDDAARHGGSGLGALLDGVLRLRPARPGHPPARRRHRRLVGPLRKVTVAPMLRSKRAGLAGLILLLATGAACGGGASPKQAVAEGRIVTTTTTAPATTPTTRLDAAGFDDLSRL